MNGEWVTEGACRDHDPALWFPPEVGGARQYRRHDPYAQARAICAGCPVLDACREHALSQREEHGMWAGMTPNQRDAWYRSRRTPHQATAAALGLVPEAPRPVDPRRKPCGTYAAYKRHVTAGEPPCQPCRQACTERNRALAQRKSADRNALPNPSRVDSPQLLLSTVGVRHESADVEGAA